jgi:predicted dithiol-disulfide oxidoreductase (DUF899 family)
MRPAENSGADPVCEVTQAAGRTVVDQTPLAEERRGCAAFVHPDKRAYKERAMAETHKVVSRNEWIEERKRLLRTEKEFTRLRDDMSRQQRDLPWVAVDKDYAFVGPDGRQTLPDLFEGRSQLIVYHFMFGPDWEAGCPHCSFWADMFNPAIVHLNQRDVTMIAVSRAPYEKLKAYEQRMGWTFKWMSSAESDFNFDYQVCFTQEALAKKDAVYNFTRQDPGASEREGLSIFYRNQAGRVFHTYSTYARGIDIINTAYNLLDLVPKGRDEGSRGQFWVRRHDEYETGAQTDRAYQTLQKGRD